MSPFYPPFKNNKYIFKTKLFQLYSGLKYTQDMPHLTYQVSLSLAMRLSGILSCVMEQGDHGVKVGYSRSEIVVDIQNVPLWRIFFGTPLSTEKQSLPK